MSKLETADEILEWARDVGHTEQNAYKHLFDFAGTQAADRATAAELARAMRLLRAFRELDAAKRMAMEELLQDPWDGTNHEEDFDRLRPALEEP